MLERFLCATEPHEDACAIEAAREAVVRVATTALLELVEEPKGVVELAEIDQRLESIAWEIVDGVALPALDEARDLPIDELERIGDLALGAHRRRLLARDAGEARPRGIDPRERLVGDREALVGVAGAVDERIAGREILHGAHALRAAARLLAVRELDEADGVAERAPVHAMEHAALQRPVPEEHLHPVQLEGLREGERLGEDRVDALMLIVADLGGEAIDEIGEAGVALFAQALLRLGDPGPEVHQRAPSIAHTAPLYSLSVAARSTPDDPSPPPLINAASARKRRAPVSVESRPRASRSARIAGASMFT